MGWCYYITWLISKQCCLTNKVTVEGNTVPLQALLGPVGARRLRLPDFQTAHEGGKVVSPVHRPPLPHRKYSCEIIVSVCYLPSISIRSFTLPCCSLASYNKLKVLVAISFSFTGNSMFTDFLVFLLSMIMAG
jgi:hypothetical protein